MGEASADLAARVGVPGRLLVADGDLEAIVAGCTRTLRPHRLVPTGKRATLAARLYHLSLGAMSFNRLSYGADVRVEPTHADEEDFLITLPVAGAARFRYRRDEAAVRPGQAAITGPYGRFRFDIGSAFDQVIVRLDRRSVEAVCAGLIGSERRRQVHFALALADLPADWVRLLEDVAILAQNHGAAAHPLLATRLEEMIVGSLLLAVPNTFSAEIADAGRPALPQALRRAMAYMRDHLAEPLRLHDVARESGVGLRSLQTGFRNHLGVSLTAWLREERLTRVHAALVAAVPGSTTVTQVALAWGFFHLGDFAGRYRSRFGARPSDVLAKRF